MCYSKKPESVPEAIDFLQGKAMMDNEDTHKRYWTLKAGKYSMVELKSEKEAALCSTEDKRYLGMIWEENLDESMGDWKVPWRIWSEGKSHVRYPEFSKLKGDWEWTRAQLQKKYDGNQNMDEDEWRVWQSVRYAKF